GEAQEPERIAAPDFSVEDQEGNTVNFSDFVGKPVVINFWASWCPPCKAEMPEFDTVYRELGDEVTFLMINSTDGGRETVETARAYIDGQDYAFPVYFDTSQEASYLYGISSLPTTVFIDRDGYLITGAMGMIDEATLRRGIDMITDNSALP
ncbi:MAG: TlpA family protein disulfide reductase, partial [Lachnospiraceae bacterium]|nr:TlpA family protein disulfide reductase [Lachnospiraceae bacterium]